MRISILIDDFYETINVNRHIPNIGVNCDDITVIKKINHDIESPTENIVNLVKELLCSGLSDTEISKYFIIENSSITEDEYIKLNFRFNKSFIKNIKTIKGL